MKDDDGTLSLVAAFLGSCAAFVRPSLATKVVAQAANQFAAHRAGERMVEAYRRKRVEDFMASLGKAKAEAQQVSPSAEVRAALNVLGLGTDFSRHDLKVAYRLKAKLAHEDTGGTHEAMVELNAARACVEKWRGWD